MIDATHTPPLTSAQKYALELEPEITDVFDLAKTVHQIMINFDSDVSPFSSDPLTALKFTITMLREEIELFESIYFHPCTNQTTEVKS